MEKGSGLKLPKFSVDCARYSIAWLVVIFATLKQAYTAQRAVTYPHNENNEEKGVFGQEFAYNFMWSIQNRKRYMNKNFIVNEKCFRILVFMNVCLAIENI